MADTKTRTELQDLFKQGAKPTGANFSDFIDSVLNIKDDGIQKQAEAEKPLRVTAQGPEENLLDFGVGDTGHTWRINQKPGGMKISGLNISNASGSKLFIDSATGNVGIGTTEPGAKLAVKGGLHVAGDLAPGDKNLQVDGDTMLNGTLSIKGTDIQGEAGRNYFKDAEKKDGKGLRVGAAWGMYGIYAESGFGVLGGKDGVCLQQNKMVVKSNGNVGIGMTEPKAKLDVQGDFKLKNGIAINGFSNDGTLGGDSDLTVPTEKAVRKYVDGRYLRIESGSVTDSGYKLRDGSGNREFKKTISFSKSFSSTPKVIVGITGLDAENKANLRVRATAINIQKNKFDIHFFTWADTRLWDVTVNWFAYGS